MFWKPEFVGSVSDFLKHDPAYFNRRIYCATLSLTLFDPRLEGNFPSNRYKYVPSTFTVTIQ
jgi:hypothetical protein